MHPCDNTCAIIIIICLIEGLSDKLTGNQSRLPYYLIGKNARFVKLSYNDLGMIKASKAGFLFRSTDKIKAEYPHIPAYETYDELLGAIKKAMAE